ncbi:hypothetical protein BRETT_004253 [Brettanomyces bruxellensis]|uniref:Peroxidase n=1 Tax=Dekkera bruxellensis TaxID=5007 RepID=A0A871R7H7_DEKBR|nr:uncharacterized protein BRETT_004253 [Brettanomyces bruxellensis]QOU19032.1 hypothetical protein BRETT_004253 [Brettanomyces bruxellensis]
MGTLIKVYERITNLVKPLGKFVLIPLATVRTVRQFTDYLFYSIFISLYVFFKQAIIHEQDEDSLPFTDLVHEYQLHYRDELIERHLDHVEQEFLNSFDIPSSFSDIFKKISFRVDYYYDRYIIHVFELSFGKNYKYGSESHNPLSIVDDLSINDENLNVKPKFYAVNNDSESNSIHNIHRPESKAFEPKPYLMKGGSLRQTHPTDQLVSQNVQGKFSKPSSPLKPALTDLFEKPRSNDAVPTTPVSNTSAASSPTPTATTESVISAAENFHIRTPTIQRSIVEKTKAFAVKKDNHSKGSHRKEGSRNVFYKIKIRRKGRSQIDPTYGNYELVRQRIKNCLVQPSYKPDGNIGPNMIRFTWHCCAHYDRETGTGGCSGGTMRFAQEFNDNGNTGLNTAKSYLDQIHEEFPWVSFADLYSLGGVAAVEGMGGPRIEWKPGRTDCLDAKKVPPMGRLPIATLGSDHIREVFTKRLGFEDKETVALIGGGHSLGGCHAKFSGFNGIWSKKPFRFDNDFFKVLLNEKWSIGVVPQTGIEQYYNEDKSLMMLNTDMEMIRDPEFKKWTEIYAKDEQFFFEQFAAAYAKLVELGVIRDDDGIQRVKM